MTYRCSCKALLLLAGTVLALAACGKAPPSAPAVAPSSRGAPQGSVKEPPDESPASSSDSSRLPDTVPSRRDPPPRPYHRHQWISA